MNETGTTGNRWHAMRFIGRLDIKPTRRARIVRLPQGVAVVPKPKTWWGRLLDRFRWSPFGKRGGLQDLEAQGWVCVGAIREEDQ